MSRPRVLLVDDDASIRRFVTMALEDLDIALHCAVDVEEALTLLRATGPVQLLMTDFMMPGASGVDLLRALEREPALRGSARVVMLTAGLDAATAEQLPALGVWQLLHKPVSLADLLACVETALEPEVPEVPEAAASSASPGTTPRTAPPASGAPARSDTAAAAEHAGAPAADPGSPALHPARAAALERFFGNDRPLFLAYHASCVREFARDIPGGDAAVAARDAPALRRLAHSLKSVLATLGYQEQSALARQLENAAAAQDWGTAVPLWNALGERLEEVRTSEAQMASARG